MRRTLALLPLAVLLFPLDAFACINTIWRDIATNPADFMHFGLAFSAALLLLFRGQAKSWSKKPTEEVAYGGPSLTREVMWVAASVIAGVGIGLFKARFPELQMSRITNFGLLNLGLVLFVLALSRVATFGRLWVWVRRLTLAFVLLTSSIQAHTAWTGEVEFSTWEQPKHPELLPEQHLGRIEF